MQIAFKNSDRPEFYMTLRRRVDEYFTSNGISKHGDHRMVIKSLIILTGFFTTYTILLSNILNPWIASGFCFLLGISKALIGFNIAHDAAHGAYSKNTKVNNVLSYAFEMLGTSSYLWKIAHNVIHHTYTNIPEHDDDLEPVFLIRLNPTKKALKIHKYQHWYATFFYGLTSISWVFLKDNMKIFKKEIGNYKVQKHAKKDIVIMFASKIIYYFTFIALPLIIIDLAWWQIIIGFIAVHFAQGISLAIVFQLAHVVEEAEITEADHNGSMENSWAIHQLMTTSNFARKSRLANFLFGGLNFQVEHHLFPRICHIHYKPLSEIVKETAEEYNIPYNENKTMWQAMKSHYKTLKRLGVQEEMKMA